MEMLLILLLVTSTTVIPIYMQAMHSKSPSRIHKRIYYGGTTALDTYH